MISILLTIPSNALGLNQFNKQEETHLISNNNSNSERSTCLRNRKYFCCICGVCMTVFSVPLIAPLSFWSVMGITSIFIFLCVLIKISFDREYVTYDLYLKECCKKILKMDKVIVKIPNYCENENGDIHYHLNVGYHPKMNDGDQYIYVGNYKDNDYNSNQLTQAVFWKFDEKSICNAKRCSNIRLVTILSLALISCSLYLISPDETRFVSIHLCFVIGLLESLCVSRLIRCCVVIEVFVIMTEVHLFPIFETAYRSDVVFDGECISTYEFTPFAWSVALRVFFYYCATLAMSNKESKKTAFLMLISQTASILDLMTDLTVVYVWILFKNYYIWSLFQCLILLSSQFIQIYFIIKKYEMYSRLFKKKEWQNVSNKQLKSNCIKMLDLLSIVIGIGKLWFGAKKLANISSLAQSNTNSNTNDKNNSNKNNSSYSKTSFEMIKIWEFLFESFPTLLLSCYILLNEREAARFAIVASMIVSFSNLSMTLVRAMLRSKRTQRNKKKSNVKVEQNMDGVLFSSSNSRITSPQTSSIELAYTTTHTKS